MKQKKLSAKSNNRLWLMIMSVILLTGAAFFYLISSKDIDKSALKSSEQKTAENIKDEVITQKEPLANDLNFIPDSGIRIADGATPEIGTANGQFNLLYEKKAEWYVSSSANGIYFSNETKATDDQQQLFRAHKLPDGTYRSYYFTKDGIMTSSFSDDGKTYTEESGVRYIIQKEDNGSVGTYDFFNDKNGGVVLLYVGDIVGKNNVRRAYSTDNGKTFAYTNNNVFGDDDALESSEHYTDQNIIVLPDSRIRAFTIKKGAIYSFISSDGKNFSMEPELRLAPNDFKDLKVASLHNPKIISLSDGRYRIYVCAKTSLDDNARSMILSATTKN